MKREPKVWTLTMRAIDRRIFNCVRQGKKKLETRALNNPRGSRYYGNIRTGDRIRFVCGKDRVVRTVGWVRKYRSAAALFRAQPFRKISPWTKSKAEAAAMYGSFPGYSERIRRFGIICFELK